MLLVKHDAIANFDRFREDEKRDLLVQEISKAVIFYPQATADVFDYNKIEYASKTPVDLLAAFESQPNNMKMINQIIRISLLVNQQGQVKMMDHNRLISYRKLMIEGKSFIKQHPEIVKQSVLLTKQLMKEEMFSKTLNNSVNHYLNLDGGEIEEMGKVDVNPPSDNKTTSKSNREIDNSKSRLFFGAAIVIGALLIGSIAISIYKSKSQA